MSDKNFASENLVIGLYFALLLSMLIVGYTIMWNIKQVQEDFEQATYRCVMIDKTTFECGIVLEGNDNE